MSGMNVPATIDQIFILFTRWVASFFPPHFRPLIGDVLGVIGIISVFPSIFALTVLLERKGLGRIQNRYGPNRVGPFGLFQPIADGVKSLTKEDVVPFNADQVVHFLAPVILLTAVFMGYAVLPVGRNMELATMDAGLLFFFAMSASSELSVFMAGWSSRNKYSLLGAMRAVAQMISYEVPLLLSSVVVVMIAGSLSLPKIVEAQTGYTGGWPHWYVFTPWGFAAFIIFGIAATAETNRSPFDLPEGESELVAGYLPSTRASSSRFSSLPNTWPCFPSRGSGHTVSGRMVGAVFVPDRVPSWFWFFAKVMVLSLRLHLGARHPATPAPGPVDELRVEVRAALSLLNLGVTALWRFMGEGWARWVVCSAILIVAYVIIGRVGMRASISGPGVIAMLNNRTRHQWAPSASKGSG